MTDWLTTTEAAALLNVDQSRIRQMAGKELEARKWGRDWQVSRASVEAWRESHRDAKKRGRKTMAIPMRSREGYYDMPAHMDPERLAAVTEYVNGVCRLKRQPPFPQDRVQAICFAPWDGEYPDLFRRWLTESPIEEIGDWVLSGGC